MLKYLKKYWVWCLLAPLFMFGEAAMDLIQPQLMAEIVDKGVLVQDMDVILGTGIRMILFVLVGGVCGILSGVCTNLAGQQFGNDLRKDLFAKIMQLSFQQTDQFTTGSLVTRIANDVNQVQGMVMMSVRGLVRNTTLFLGGIVMLYLQSPKFAGIAAIGLPFMVALTVFFMKKTSPLFSIVQKKLDVVNNVMQEDIAGARVVKAYVKEDYEMEQFDRANEELCGINLRVQSILAFMGPCMNIILNLLVVGIIYVGGITVQNNGVITTGEIMAALTYIAQILHGVMFMANIFQTFTRAQASATRIQEVMDCETAIQDGPGAAEQKSGRDMEGEIEFRHVGFSYPNTAGRSVLEDLSFSVHKGETMAIVGATGCGKSSLVNLIPRFYEADSGEVLVDGVNVKDYTLKELRDKIAIVLQRAELYSRPIEANIRWGKDNATPFEIKAAAEVAQADDFIVKTPDGYYTQVTEGGHSLSGGQKQRISIARAVLKKPEILIFDDSTSALDLKTEARLYEALKESCPGTTKIIVAQRIASIKGADRIVVLDDGKISALGTHEELLKNSPIYRDIFYSQLKEGEKLA